MNDTHYRKHARLNRFACTCTTCNGTITCPRQLYRFMPTYFVIKFVANKKFIVDTQHNTSMVIEVLMFLLQELVKLQHMHAILVHCVPFSIYWEKPASLEDELLV